MLAVVIIVFREVLEAGLIIGIVMAASRGIAGRNFWVVVGVAGGVLGALLIAMFAGALAAPAAGKAYRDSSVARAAPESVARKFLHGLLDLCTCMGWELEICIGATMRDVHLLWGRPMRRRETYLDLAQHHAAEAEARVARQNQIINDIERDNHPEAAERARCVRPGSRTSHGGMT